MSNNIFPNNFNWKGLAWVKRGAWGPSAALIIIFFGAVLIRVTPVIKTPEQMRLGLGGFGDTGLYHRIAYHIYRGNGFSGVWDPAAYGISLSENEKRIDYAPTFTRAPGYPLFLAVIYRTLGNPSDMLSALTWRRNWDKVRLVQCVLDASICILVFFLVRLIQPGPFWPPILAAMVYACSFYNIFYTRALLSETLATFLVTLAVFFLTAALVKKIKGWWILSGGVFALVCLVRPEYVLFPFFFLAVWGWQERKTWVGVLQSGVIFLMAFGLLLFPWIWRNHHVFNKPALSAKAGLGYSLYLGTFETGRNWTGWGEFPDEIFSNLDEKKRIEELYEQFAVLMESGDPQVDEVSAAFQHVALERIRRDPAACLEVWLSKIPRLWYQFYVPMYRDREASGGFFLFYFFFAMMAWAGANRSERVLMAPIVWLCGYLTLIYLPLHVEPRYSVTAMPSLIALTGVGLGMLFYRIRTFITERKAKEASHDLGFKEDGPGAQDSPGSYLS